MTKRDRMMVFAVLAVVLVGGFWFLVLAPQRKAASAAEAQLGTATTELEAAKARLTAGREARDAFRRDRTTIIKLGRVVPESDDIPTLLTQLELLAKREKVDFTSYSIDASGAGASSSASSAASGASGATATPTTTGTRSTDTVAPLYTPGSVEVAGGLARTPIAIKLTGTYFHLEAYLRAVQRFAVLSAKRTDAKGRLIIVDGFGYTPVGGETKTDANGKPIVKKSKSPELNASLSASVYYAPPVTAPSASAGGAATPGAAPAAGATTASTSTGAAAVGGLR
jgi:Tfp pilus assembly protein PilO